MADQSHTTNPSETERHHDDDDPFVALWAKRESAKAEYEAAGSVYGPARPGSAGYEELDKANTAAGQRVQAIDQEIANCLTATPFGLVVKLRIVWEQEGYNFGRDLADIDDADLQVEHLLLKGALYSAEWLADTTAASADRPTIRQLVSDIETPIIEADECYATMCKLIDYVEDRELKNIMGRVSIDNSRACVEIRRLFNDLHSAAVRAAS